MQPSAGPAEEPWPCWARLASGAHARQAGTLGGRLWYSCAPHAFSPQITLPEKIDLMKTAPHKELAPYDADWYFTRAGA